MQNCKLGKVENLCTSHNISLFAIILPKIIKIGGNLTKFHKNNFAQFFWDTVYISQPLSKNS